MVVNTLHGRYALLMDGLSFGDWVRGNRVRRKLSQGALARQLEMAPSYVSRLESGNIGLPTEETRARFHALFETTEQELIELGIVPQFDNWGRPIPAHSAVQESPAAYTTLSPEDDDAPLTPEESDVLKNIVFSGLAGLSNSELREVIAIIRRRRGD